MHLGTVLGCLGGHLGGMGRLGSVLGRLGDYPGDVLGVSERLGAHSLAALVALDSRVGILGVAWAVPEAPGERLGSSAEGRRRPKRPQLVGERIYVAGHETAHKPRITAHNCA